MSLLAELISLVGKGGIFSSAKMKLVLFYDFVCCGEVLFLSVGDGMSSLAEKDFYL